MQLAVTLAAAFFERGDAGQAVRTCRKAIAKAETIASPTARASAYWNASMLEAERGTYSDAVPLAARALALLAEGQDSRNLARLRTQLGIMQLRLDPPQVAEAQANLEQAAGELVWCSAGPVEIARNDLALARVHFLDGNPQAARELSTKARELVGSQSPIVAADARSLEGQASALEGDLDGAKAGYHEAVMILSAVGSDRGAGQLWFELAGLLEDVGDFDAARDAYRSAAASAGLRTRTVVRATTSPGLYAEA